MSRAGGATCRHAAQGYPLARPDFRAAAVRRLSEEGDISPAIVRFLSPERHGRPTEARVLPIDRIASNPDRARATIDDAAVAELAASIEEHGLLQPVLVRPLGADTYRIVAGEVRWRAARLAGLGSIPVLVEELDDRTALEISLIANLHRTALSRLDEAEAFERMIVVHGCDIGRLARRLGRRKRYIRKRLRQLARHRARVAKRVRRAGTVTRAAATRDSEATSPAAWPIGDHRTGGDRPA